MSPSLPPLHRTVALVVVAVIAVLLVLVVLVPDRDRPEAEPPAPAAARSTPGATSAGVVAGRELRRLRLEDLPVGARPRIGYVDGPAYVTPDGVGTRLRTPDGLSGLVPWRDGFLLADTQYFEGTLGLALRDGTGRVVHEWPSAGHPVGARDGRVAWTRVTVSEATHPGRARVFVGSPEGRLRVQTVEPGIIAVLGLTGGRVVFERWWGQGVYVTDLERRPQRLAWWPRRLRPGMVSPEGRRILASAGRTVQVRDLRSGDLLRSLEIPGGDVRQVVWEDGGHLLAVVTRARRTAVVRLGLGGRVELATPVRAEGDPGHPAYVLATRP